jgi:hypothetical protein
MAKHDYGYTYMARVIGKSIEDRELYKIGKTVNPTGRLRLLSHQYKSNLELVALSHLINDVAEVERIVLVFFADCFCGGVPDLIPNGRELVYMDDMTAKRAISNITNIGVLPLKNDGGF